MEPACRLALEAGFGSLERWRDALVACAKALAGEAGWVTLVFQPGEGRLVLQAACDPMRALAGGVPVLALEMVAHASPLAAGAAVDAFMADINWAGVYARYQQAVHAASEPFGRVAEEIGDALLLDVRRAGVFAQSTAMIPGALWRDPATVGVWSSELPADREVVVYCVYGHEVGRATALRLRASGLNARYLQGGIDGWQAAGRPTQPKGAAT
jgi:Fe-Mn family superoxide dismutase